MRAPVLAGIDQRGPAAACANAGESRGVIEFDAAERAEIAVLYADIDVLGDRCADASECLPGRGAIAVAELLEVGVADAAATEAAPAGVVTDLEHAVDHA